jgi:transcriptional regulator with XRE-family HTH domain
MGATVPSTNEKPSELGQRIRAGRVANDLSLGDLARATGISKSYLSALESRPNHSKPSAETLYEIAKALGTTMSELMGRRLLTERPTDIPPALKRYAKAHDLPEADILMLAGIEFRGERPRTPERWDYIYRSIKMSEEMDRESGTGPN